MCKWIQNHMVSFLPYDKGNKTSMIISCPLYHCNFETTPYMHACLSLAMKAEGIYLADESDDCPGNVYDSHELNLLQLVISLKESKLTPQQERIEWNRHIQLVNLS